jgi:hypothetical protein
LAVDHQLKEALELSFGRQPAALMLALGFTIREAARTAAAVAIPLGRRLDDEHVNAVLSNPFAVAQITRGINGLVQCIIKPPDGTPLSLVHGAFPDLDELVEHFGERAAGLVCHEVAFPTDDGMLGSWASCLHDWFGPEVVARIRAARQDGEQQT